jgi:hypothetical protein
MHSAALLEDDPGTEESNSGDDLTDDSAGAGRVGHHQADHGERRGSSRD